ncbi:MAG TPA: Smr/MutS family protein, partial [Blastocatellia bacterium]|nr:Smr/MutS family protein [Blastocatellia bacterium]
RYADLGLHFERREKGRSREFEQALGAVMPECEAEAKRIVARATDKTEQVRLRKAAEAGAARMRGEARARVAALRPARVAAAAAAPADAPEFVAGPIEPGVEVFVRGMGQRGTVESVEGGRVDVRMGMLKMRVGIDDVERVAQRDIEPAATRLPAGVRVDLVSDDMVSSELNLIGRHTDEASDMLDKFLDEAFLGSLPQVRIIHGFGTGALKRAVADLLSRHPHVASFGPAPSSEGGGGATLVQLRK